MGPTMEVVHDLGRGLKIKYCDPVVLLCQASCITFAV